MNTHPFSKWGQDFSKMRHRAFVFYSRNYALAQKYFPEFESEWDEVKEEWLKNDNTENDKYFKELSALYSRH